MNSAEGTFPHISNMYEQELQHRTSCVKNNAICEDNVYIFITNPHIYLKDTYFMESLSKNIH